MFSIMLIRVQGNSGVVAHFIFISLYEPLIPNCAPDSEFLFIEMGTLKFYDWLTDWLWMDLGRQFMRYG